MLFQTPSKRSKQPAKGFPQNYRRYAPIFVDLLADYFLSISWDEFHDEPKTVFSAKCYAALTEYEGFLPAHGQRFLQYAQQRDLFANYDQWKNIQRGLSSVLQRLNREAWFEEVNECTASLRESALPDFHLYFAELEQQLA